MIKGLFSAIAPAAVVFCRQVGLGALVIAHTAYAFEDPGAFGMGGASVARTAALTHLGNPAALAMVGDSADIQLMVPAGEFRQRHWALAQNRLQALQNADSLTTTSEGIQALENTRYDRQFAAGGQLALPRMPYAFAAHTYGRFEEHGRFGTANIVMNGGQIQTDFPQEVLGVARIDSGVTLAKVYRATPGGTHRLAVGLRPQLSMLTTYFTRAQVGIPLSPNANQASISHPPRMRLDRAGFNLDLGLVHEFNYDWTWGLQVRDVVPRSLPFGDNGEVFHLNPRATAGVQWHPSTLRWVLDVDLNAAPGFGFVQAQQNIATGIDFAGIGGLHLRAGANLNLAAFDQRCASVGMGWNGRWMMADGGYRRCADSAEGVALGLALKL